MKKAKYLVTDLFGTTEQIGDIIDCYVLCKSDDKALIYHSKENGGCGCFTICTQNENGQYINVDKDAYCNQECIDKDFKQLLTNKIRANQSHKLKVKVQFNKEELQKDIQEFKNQMKECVEQLTKSMTEDFMGKITKNAGKYVTHE